MACFASDPATLRRSRTLSLTALALLAAACSAASGEPNAFSAGGGDAASASTAIAGSGGATGSGGAGGDTGLIDAGPTDSGIRLGGDPTTCEEAAIAKTYVGCDFWPTVVANNVWSTFDYAVVVANAGAEPADVQVTRNGQLVGAAQIQPNALSTIYLPWVPELKGPDTDTCGTATPLTASVRVTGGAYHLVSSRPVAVYQFNALEYQGAGGPPGKSWASCPGNQFCETAFSPIGCFSFSNDASLLLPTTAMTGNYRITGQKGFYAADMGAYFAVTGTENATKVTVLLGTKAKTLEGGGLPEGWPNGTLELSLDAGDVVEIVGTDAADLSGTLVKADRPVQVIAGLPCTQSPLGTQACDHIEESVFPAETLGKRYFVAVPSAPNGDVVGHVVRLYGNVDGTTLTYPAGAPQGAPETLNAGQVVDLDVVSQDFEVVGDHEFAVGTFMLGAELVDPFSLPSKGDPSQSLVSAVEQFRTKYVFLAPGDYDVSYVDVVQPLGATLVLDGAPVGIAPKPIGAEFGVTRIPLGPGIGGAHVLTASDPVGIQVMGYGAYTSYQYPGGLDLEPIAPPPPK